MTMEVLAAEFPDIFHQFIEIVPDPNKPDQQIYVYEENINQITSGQEVSTVECKTGNKENVYVEVKKEISADKINDEDVSDETEDDVAARAILQEYDYDQIINKDANKNMTSYVSKNQAFKNTTFSHDTSVGSKEESTVLTNKVVTYEESVPSPLVPTIADTSANLLISTVPSPMTNSSTVHSPMTSSSTKLVQSFNKDPLLTSARYQETFAPTIDDVEDILADLVTLHSDVNSNIQLQLDTAKSGYGCSWSYVTNTCLHGLSCPFTAKILDLDQVSSSVTNVTVTKQTGSAPGTKVHNVVVLKQTPHGLVKVPESMVSQHHLTRFRGMQSNVVMAPNMQAVSYSNPRQHQTMPLTTSRTMTPTSSSMYQYINTQQQYHSSQATTLPLGEHDTNVRSYRPPANSVFVKVPQVQQQLSVTDPGVGGGVILCTDCDTKFADNKSLVKHTRNQHQVYQCSKCGESTVGYYRMASHTKRNHTKEPVFFCNCGRNFSEKRGLTKHQNSCTYYTQN